VRAVCRPDASGVARNVTYGRVAASFVALWHDGAQWRVADVPAVRAVVSHARNLAGEPSDTVELALEDLGAGAVVDPETAEQLRLRGALARCAQVVGGMERVLELVLAHVNQREQFGRAIGRFQGVQFLVADIATEAALARAATDTAVARAAGSDWQHPDMLFTVAVAASCVGHASSVVVRNAHQVLGAIGTTLEHELHVLTKPILVRRSEFGSVHEWDRAVTALAVSAGGEGLWPLITSGRPAPGAGPDRAGDLP
jgi:acyl-CoA dehydrogenase